MEAEPERPCRSAREVERWLANPDLRIVGAAKDEIGIQGAYVLTLSEPEGPTVFRAKWRALSTTDQHTRPRRELAAYAVQQLFLEPHEYVVPPAAAYCFELSTYRRKVDATAQPTLPGTRCVFGVLSYWLENTQPLLEADWLDSDRGPLDTALFREDAAYARAAAQLNLLTYLIDHDDSHRDQFLVTNRPSPPRLFVVDNTMCFTSPSNDSLEPEDDWSHIQVPALPRDEIEQLLAIGPAELQSLASIESFELDEQRRLLRRARTRARGDLEAGIRWVAPEHLQVGLERVEIGQLSRRLLALQKLARDGEYRLF